MLEILLTRHGKTERSEPEQYLGQKLDVALNQAGRDAAATLGRRLADVPLDRVISSPLRRAFETAEIVRPDATVERDARIAEADYGEWEGHTREEIRRTWPDLRAAWEADPSLVAPPNGESAEDVAGRAEAFLLSLLEWDSASPDPAAARRVLVVAHSTFNRVLLARALEVPLGEYRRRFRQDWANLTVLRYLNGVGPELTLCNDVSHIRGLHGVTWGDLPPAS